MKANTSSIVKVN